MSRLIICDFDGTLVPVQEPYYKANDLCLALLRQEFGDKCPPKEEVVKLQQQIDIERIREWEFDAERFPGSWVITYGQLCRRLGQKVRLDLIPQLYDHARSYMEGPFNPYPGVVEALEEIRSRGHRLHLVTSARRAERFQLSKIYRSGLQSFFEGSITITGVDKREDFYTLSKNQRRRAVIVGDSNKHDIEPGRQLGVWTIEVCQQNSWSFTQGTAIPDYTVQQFSETPPIIEQLSD